MPRSLMPIALLLPTLAFAGEKHLVAPPLSLRARAIVRERMANHSKQMTALVWAVVLIDFAETAKLANAIASEPRLSPSAGPSGAELNAALPPRFLELQEKLRTSAHQLQVTATLHDAAAMAKSYGALAETCVTCHHAYISKQ